MKEPSEKQIKFANEIAEKLDLDFPRGDCDFTAKAYFDFINIHIQEYNQKFPKVKQKCVNYNFSTDDEYFYGFEYF